MIFETHAHYDDERFTEDQENVLADLPRKGISPVINVGASIASTRTTLELAQKYDFIYAAVGVHPSDIDGLNEETFAWLTQQTTYEKTVAVGEIGLDYYWVKDVEKRALQREWFIRQIELANQLHKPIAVHSRDAIQDTFDIMKEHRCKGLLHCFSGTKEMAKEFTKLGYYIALGGALTFKNARHSVEVAETVDEKYLLTETDCPYMTPVPFRGKRNEPCYIPYILKKMADVRGVSEEHMAETVMNNYHRYLNCE